MPASSGGPGDKSAITTHTLEPTSPPRVGRRWRRLVFVQLALLLVVAFVWLVWQLAVPIAHTVVLFLLGIAFAFVLSDPASYLTQRLGGRRSLGIALAYLLAFVIVCAALVLLAAPVVQELRLLDANLSTYQAQLQSQSSETDTAAGNLGIHLDLASEVSRSGPATQADVSTALHDVIVVLSAVGGMLANALLILVVSVYILTGAPGLQDNLRRAVPRRHRGVHKFVQSSAARVMGAYLRGQLIMALVIGALAAGGTWFLGLPYFLTLGVLAGMFEMVPMFGPILSAIPAVFVALFQPWPTVV